MGEEDCVEEEKDARFAGWVRTLELDEEEKPFGSGMPGTLDLAPGGERSCATQVGTSEFDVDIVRAAIWELRPLAGVVVVD